MINHTDTINPDSPIAKKVLDKAITKWKRECIRSVVSGKSLRKGGRSLRREVERREIQFFDEPVDDEETMTMIFTDKGVTKGRLTILLETTEPVEL